MRPVGRARRRRTSRVRPGSRRPGPARWPIRWSGWRPTGKGRITTRGAKCRICSTTHPAGGLVVAAGARRAGRRSAARRRPESRRRGPASSARSSAVPRVPLSPAVRSRMPVRYPASTARSRVPAQVSSTSSRWAAMASRSTGMGAPHRWSRPEEREQEYPRSPDPATRSQAHRRRTPRVGQPVTSANRLALSPWATRAAAPRPDPSARRGWRDRARTPARSRC